MTEQRQPTGTSIFDPVLAEIIYSWFCPQGGVILDPFAGGSVRGIVAARMGRRYHGIDIRPEQIAANERQAERICPDNRPDWRAGDGRDAAAIFPGLQADFIFSCPPYMDLEKYSKDPRDLSNMSYAAFRAAYAEIIANSCAMLKEDRFACFVAGEVRRKDGGYHGFVPATIRAFERAGLTYYNEAILLTVAGSLPMRAGKPFMLSRKLGKTHQNILVFCKGNPRRAARAIGEITSGDLADADLPCLK